MAFQIRGAHYIPGVDHEGITQTIPVGIYDVGEVDQGLYITRRQDQFVFSHEVYDMTEGFTDRVVEKFTHINRTLGVLMYGKQGTGKTVIAKAICNRAGVPVLVINRRFYANQVRNLLHEMNGPFVLYIDEYEKIYGTSNELLGLLDGAHTPPGRWMFLATCNETVINPHLLNRPGRVLYVRDFPVLDPRVMAQIVKDSLTNFEYFEDTIHILTHIVKDTTVDICRAVVEEINQFDMTPIQAIKHMNINFTMPRPNENAIVQKDYDDEEDGIE